ncbi:unnamed protein product [Rotaria sordida]|uniref:Uncharacterized protein n=1 Tax=Rotaria sordida TaxID=392033 RepID=A0A819T0U4_9BILA|nr:unnamed protein product [Rotaria sordida]CAF4071970.1 unnamed protein product [Rotaria sordida]
MRWLSNVHQNIREEVQKLNIDKVNHDNSNESNTDIINYDDSNESNFDTATYDDSNNLNIETINYDNSNEFNIETYDCNNSNVLDTGGHLYENSINNLSSCFITTDKSLHNWTNISTHQFCTKLLILLRDAKICKSQTNKLIQLIQSGLPTPNNMPKSMKQILTEMQGLHVGGRGGKRQYYYEDGIQFRDSKSYVLESVKAAETSSNVFGHLGRSILHDLLDVPLPYSIISDYLHVSLLRHTRVIVKQIYSSLLPQERSEFDARLLAQKFPHFFNRKLRAVGDFSFINLLPHLLTYLAEERLAHIALFVCFIRIDFALRNVAKTNEPASLCSVDGPFDQTELTPTLFLDIHQHHLIVCGCDKPYQCVQVFRRCMIDKKVYHSLIYFRRNSSISYFVQYRQNQNGINFGKIKFFFTSNHGRYAFIEHHEIKTKFSKFFKSSSYYDLLCKSIDYFFFVLHSSVSSTHCVPISSIENYCIVFENTHHIIVTPLSIDYEHD